jgi:aminoglycoside phosphotransferase (APT) family kinase protein
VGSEAELLDRQRVIDWLAGQGVQLVDPEHVDAELMVEPIASGYSNVMFKLTAGDEHLVLRRPAAVPLEGADTGMRREFRFLRALEGTDVPHPEPIAFCDDTTVTGSAFYVMRHVDGFMPVDPLPEAFRGTDAHAELAFAVTDAIAALACVDWRAAGLEDLGRPDGFHERQVRRWLKQYTSYPEQELPDIERIGDWLGAHIPSQWEPAIMHGDYHSGNLLVALDRPARVAAIVDWETATIGDPLLDLAGFLRFWFETRQSDDWPDRDEMIARYIARTARDVPDLTYYDLLARFRLAVLIEGIHQRSKLDPTRDVATDLHQYALVLVASGLEIARAGPSP